MNPNTEQYTEVIFSSGDKKETNINDADKSKWELVSHPNEFGGINRLGTKYLNAIPGKN